MRTLKAALASTVAIAALAFSAPAMGQRVIPPGNSAATQYTETVPTAGGNTPAKHTRKRADRSPAKVLGPRNARRLESAGPEGSEVAEVAATTAPIVAPPKAPGRTAPGRTGIAPQESLGGAHPGSLPDGSSGLGRVVAAATGSSDSGDLGILLPLAILAAFAGSAAYFWRHRHTSG